MYSLLTTEQSAQQLTELHLNTGLNALNNNQNAPPVANWHLGANKMNDIQKLEMIGVAMFCEQWQSAIAKKLGVNDRTVRRWAAGDIQINQNIFADLERALMQRQKDLRLTLRVLRHGELFTCKTVNIKHLKNALADECSNYSDMGSFSDFVDLWVQENIEIPMSESAGLDKNTDSVYAYIDNANELRDCQNDFVSEILEKSVNA